MDDYYGNKKNECGMEKICCRFLGQPIEVLTSDGVRYCGIVLTCCGEALEIIDRCSRVIFIPFRHIDAIVEPKMKLTPFCGERDCDCRREHEECECEREHGYDRG